MPEEHKRYSTGMLFAIAQSITLASTTMYTRSSLDRKDYPKYEPRTSENFVVGEVQPLTVSQTDKEKVMRANGMKPFKIEGVTIWAINEKSAKNKYLKTL